MVKILSIPRKARLSDWNPSQAGSVPWAQLWGPLI